MPCDATTLQQCIQLPIEEKLLVEVTTKAKDWAIMHGAAMRSKTNFSPDSLNFAPFVLTPSSFPRNEFEKAVALQTILNRLMHNVAHDEEFLTTTLAETIKVDEFTANLFTIYKKVLANGFTQPISLGLIRSDLMLESRCPELIVDHETGKKEKPCAYCCWKQVEINTIASGFGHLGPASKAIQRFMQRVLFRANNSSMPKLLVANNFLRYLTFKAYSVGLLRSDYLAHIYEGNAIKQVEINTVASSFGGISTYMKPLQSYVLCELDQAEKLKNMPENNALSGLCDGMIKAWEIYANPKAVIMFIIEEVSYNICDQRFHEFYIREKNPNIKILRKTLTEVHNEGKLGLKKELWIDADEVAVIYFRAGYEPGHYHSQNEWDARYLMECSLAIKCPSIHYHLAGTKKVQQALAQPAILERFISDPEEIKAVGKIFTGLYSLDDTDAGCANYEMALKDPERFVLKPQREGGGNNVYGSDISDALKKMSRIERSAWILMDLIHPPVSKGYMVRPGNPMPPALVDLVSELGIFGVIIGDVDNIVCNYQAGHMLRTKLATANEGGVAAGLGALDSPYLVD